jgi:hypothetical protein
MLAFLRANPVVGIMLAGLAIVTLVFGVLAILMARAGVSLRPLVFLAVFMGIVAGPQVAFHLSQAYGLIPRRDLTWTFGKDRPLAGYVEQERVLAAQDGRFADPDAVFGRGFDRDLVTDLRGAGGDSPFGGAEVAQMAIIPPSGSAIVARYADASSASSASARYMTMAFGAPTATGRDGAHTFTRPQGDVAKVLVAGRTLVVLTGPDEPALAARLRSSRIVAPASSATFVPVGPISPDAKDFWLYRPAVLIGGVLLLVIIASVYFFRGAAWAGTIPAREGVAPRPLQDVRQRLLSVNSVEAPFTVVEQGDGRIAVTWRFADAKWVDLARAHGMRNTHRILLELDERSKTVYPTEQYSRLDWSAGANGGSMRWSSAKGIVFFQLEHQRVFGLQLDERGRFVPKLSYSYTFDLQEMKAPFIEAVTEAGWQWRPTLWQGPQWMRWLTH